MKLILQFAAMVGVLALAIPTLMQRLDPLPTERVETEQPTQQTNVAIQPVGSARRNPDTPRGQTRIAMGADGHFRVEARLNYKPIPVLVDTGASSVAMPRSIARRLGINLRDADFRHTARTANGETRMALATLDRVQIGGVEVRDVEAAVLGDESLDTVLLGMSFLGKLRRFSVEDGELVLVR